MPRLERRLRRRLAQGLLEQRDGPVDVLELGEEEREPRRATGRARVSASRSVAIVRARVHSPAA